MAVKKILDSLRLKKNQVNIVTLGVKIGAQRHVVGFGALSS
jgi:hypothetical protein